MVDWCLSTANGSRTWIRLAGERVAFQGLPARICWLGYGERARAGKANAKRLTAQGGLRVGVGGLARYVLCFGHIGYE